MSHTTPKPSPTSSSRTSFESLELSKNLLALIKEQKFKTPTEVQREMVPKFLSGADLVVISETGSGKTLGYLLPLLEKAIRQSTDRALILTPTRETADQTLKVLEPFAQGLGISLSLVIGGRSSSKQEKELKGKAQIVVATPGRLNDHLLNNKLLLQGTTSVVVDEADRMLDMGFLPQLQHIRKTMRGTWKTLMCSASSPDMVKELSSVFCQSEPELILMKAAEAPVEQLQQEVVELTRAEKPRRLLKDLATVKESALVFAASQERCDLIYRWLKKNGLSVDHLHGGLRQGTRHRVIRDFRDRKIKILVATDVLARGLDIPHVELVLNVDLPYHAEDFLHRIGRTARAGRTGRAITYLTPEDAKARVEIERYLK